MNGGSRMGYLVKNTTGDNVRAVANELKLPLNIVESVIRSYLGKVEDAGIRGESIVINGLVTVTPILNESTGEVSTRSRVSEAYKEKLRNSPHVKRIIERDMDYVNNMDKPTRVDMDFLQTVE